MIAMPTSIEVSPPGEVVRILAIIVVYKMKPLETPSFVSLQWAAKAVSPGTLSLKILLYDNTCGAQDPGPMPEGVEYHAADENLGLSSAYNDALRMAGSSGCDWLLTLDQDSSLPINFLQRVTEIIRTIKDDPSIAAIVPLIRDTGVNISPTWFLADAFPRYYGRNTVGVGRPRTYAFNSASTLRVKALIEVGGYNPWFWLDYSDGYIFRQLQHHHKRVFIAGNLEVAHNFASTDIQFRVSAHRYWNMRLAETAFWDLEMGVLARLERIVGLVVLAFKHFFLRRIPEHRHTTYEFLKRRIFWTRKRRLQAWERETLAQFPRLTKTRVPPYL